MSTAIDTGQVAGRRTLKFGCIDDISHEVERLANCPKIQSLGNWSPGQIFKHLSIVMNSSIDGLPPILPGFVVALLRLLRKRKFLTQPMPAGFRLPAKAAALIPPPTTFEEGLAQIRSALQRLKTESKRAPSPVLGDLTREEWDQLHCRHSELHLSFLVPDA